MHLFPSHRFLPQTLLTQEQALRLDVILVQKFGYSMAVLMEIAGLGVATVVDRLLDKEKHHEIAVVVGHGHNGGDGWVTARYLHHWGYPVSVVLIDMDATITPQQALFEKIGGTVLALEDQDAIYAIASADCVIDGIVGVGITGPLRPMHKLAVDTLNQSRGLVVAIDIPSGVHPNAGAGQVCVKADHTVAMVAPKRAVQTCAEICGQLWCVNLSLPQEVYGMVGVLDPWQGVSDLVVAATLID
jgi:NAD(P)H-hydrate epimerase